MFLEQSINTDKKKEIENISVSIATEFPRAIGGLAFFEADFPL
jgi:hypothetical protein